MRRIAKHHIDIVSKLDITQESYEKNTSRLVKAYHNCLDDGSDDSQPMLID